MSEPEDKFVKDALDSVGNWCFCTVCKHDPAFGPCDSCWCGNPLGKPKNPYPEGTFNASAWELEQAMQELWRAVKRSFFTETKK